jgi:hypothetical protein
MVTTYGDCCFVGVASRVYELVTVVTPAVDLRARQLQGYAKASGEGRDRQNDIAEAKVRAEWEG